MLVGAPDEAFARLAESIMLVPGPLDHNGPAVWSCQALLQGNHAVEFVSLVPSMMKRILRLDDEVRAARRGRQGAPIHLRAARI